MKKIFFAALLLVASLNACQRGGSSEPVSRDDYHLLVRAQEGKQQDYIGLLNIGDGTIVPLEEMLNGGGQVEDAFPSWSFDFKRIAYAKKDNNRTDVFWANSDGSGSTNLSRQLCGAYKPAWSPDGSFLSFVAWAPPCDSANSVSAPINPLLLRGQVYVYDTSNQTTHALTNFDDNGVCDVSWSRDGNRLVFQRGCTSLETGSMPFCTLLIGMALDCKG